MRQQADHRGRRYFVTGGTNGIGRYCASHLVHRGARVWVTGTRQETVDDAVAKGDATGGSVCDVSDPAQVHYAADEAYRALGRLDGFFINAGIDGEGKSAEELNPSHFTRVLQVNVTGILAAAQEAYRLLERPGAIVVNSSVNALRAEPGFADYNASKAAALSLAQSLALDWGTKGITVTAVAPGYIPSNMTSAYLNDPQTAEHLLDGIPMGRFGEPSEIAELVGFLLSNRVRYLNGTVIPIAGGRNI